eukprot:tig00000042_g15533.t1
MKRTPSDPAALYDRLLRRGDVVARAGAALLGFACAHVLSTSVFIFVLGVFVWQSWPRLEEEDVEQDEPSRVPPFAAKGGPLPDRTETDSLIEAMANTAIDKVWRRYQTELGHQARIRLDPLARKMKPPWFQDASCRIATFGPAPPILFNFRLELDFDVDYRGAARFVLTGTVVRLSLEVTVPVLVLFRSLRGRARFRYHLGPDGRRGPAWLTFLEKPELQYEVRPLAAVDLMSVPILSAWMRTQILRVARKRLVWPAWRPVYGLHAMKELGLSENGGESGAPPRFLGYLVATAVEARSYPLPLPPPSILRLCFLPSPPHLPLLEASGAPTSPRPAGRTNPRCALRCGRQKFVTRPVHDSREPRWLESCVFDLTDQHPPWELAAGEPDDGTRRAWPLDLYATVVDHGHATPSNFLGAAEVDLGELKPGQPVDRWYPLVDLPPGELRLRLELVPLGSPLPPRCPRAEDTGREESELVYMARYDMAGSTKRRVRLVKELLKVGRRLFYRMAASVDPQKLKRGACEQDAPGPGLGFLELGPQAPDGGGGGGGGSDGAPSGSRPSLRAST